MREPLYRRAPPPIRLSDGRIIPTPPPARGWGADAGAVGLALGVVFGVGLLLCLLAAWRVFG